MAHDWVAVRGARVHNLKNIDVDLPRDKLVVITGLSGSGKSSLAFDTIYAEVQRRYALHRRGTGGYGTTSLAGARVRVRTERKISAIGCSPVRR